MKNEVQKSNESSLTTDKKDINDLVRFSSLEQLTEWAKQIAGSKFTPLDKAEDVMCAVLTGKELGISPMASLNNIYPINGRGTLGIHLINALLVKAGIIIEVLCNYVPLYQYADKSSAKKDEKSGTIIYGIVLTTGDRPNEFLNDPTLYLRSPQPTDYLTKVKFTRERRLPSGTFKTIEHIEEYRYSDAIKAGLLEKPGDVWKKYPKNMMFARCCGNGANIVAPDVKLGIPTTEEMAEVNGINLTMTEDGRITGINGKKISTANTVDEIATVVE